MPISPSLLPASLEPMPPKTQSVAAALSRKPKSKPTTAGKAKRPMPRKRVSTLEESFALQAREARLPVPVREFRFHSTRLWKFDFAWPHLKIALEVEGGTWSKKGRHSSGVGFQADAIKYNEALLLGWRVLRADSKMTQDGRALEFVRRALVGYDHERAALAATVEEGETKK